MEELTLQQKLKQAEKKLAEAEAEVRVRQMQIRELKPRKASLEELCMEKFGCTPSDLANKKKELEAEAEALAEEFFLELKEASGE